MQEKYRCEQIRDYPINQFAEDRLIILGQTHNKLPCKIKSVRLNPAKQSIEKTKKGMQKNHKMPEQYNYMKYFPQLLKFWQKRYHLFSKFDQGIKLDQQSWYSVTPQRVSQYLAQRTKGVGVILDGFCGSGGDSIQFALSGKNVISNDICSQKIKCLENNAKVYQVSNKIITSQQDILTFDLSKISSKLQTNQKVQLIYLAFPWGGTEYHQAFKLSANDFTPDIQTVMRKAFQIDHQSIMMLLPANIDVENIVSVISKIRQEVQLKSQNHQEKSIICSLMLQKVYYRRKIKFVIIYYGKIAKQYIKVEEQDNFFLTMLSNGGASVKYTLFKNIYEKHGKATVFNMFFEFQKIYSDLYLGSNQSQLNIQTFCQFIQKKKQQASISKIFPYKRELKQALEHDEDIKIGKSKKRIKMQNTNEKEQQCQTISVFARENNSQLKSKLQKKQLACQQFINL